MKIKVTPVGRMALLLCVASCGSWNGFSQGTAFTYQGQLRVSGAPANGTFDFRFRLAADPLANNYVGGNVFTNGVAMSNGLFTTTLDFGGVFNGSNYWLEVAVRTNGASLYTTLAPLQPVTPTPYAVFAEGASNVFGVVPGGGLSGNYSNSVVFGNNANSFSGSFSGNGSGVTNVNATTLGGVSANGFWKTIGNSGTTPGANFIGTSDNQPLEVRVNGQRALRLEFIGPDAPNVIGGFSNNFVGPTLSGATIAGGGFNGAVNRIAGAGFNGAIGGGRNNAVSNFNGTVSGGANNLSIGNAASVGGGSENTAGGDHDVVAGGQANRSIGDHSSIAGGLQNTNNGPRSVIGGGEANLIGGSADRATIGGGGGNVIIGSDSLPVYGTIAGGNNNSIQIDTSFATIGGGIGNTIQAGAHQGIIGGGAGNVIQSGSTNSVVGGGGANSATNSYATVSGGSQNLAGGPGAFVGGGGFDGANFIGNQATGPASVVNGGLNNLATNQYATVGGGYRNAAGGNMATVSGGDQIIATGSHAVAGGGYQNVIGGNFATVSGGYQNNASATWATIPGGFGNAASGLYSFAAGNSAHASHDGTFIWADAQGSTYSSDRNNQFKVRAGGGVILDVSSSAGLNPAALYVNSTSANGVGLYVAESSTDAGVVFNNAGSGSIIKGFNGGGSPVFEVLHSGAVNALSFNPTSDRNAKENAKAISTADILAKVASLPITQWHYKVDRDAEHIGPMAQDFHAAFGLNGADDKHISVVDEGGVALAAIQGLHQKLVGLEKELQRKDAENAELMRRLDALEKVILKR